MLSISRVGPVAWRRGARYALFMTAPLDAAGRAGKWEHLTRTADGGPRAAVALTRWETLWVNTGSLCNIECASCYIESSPTNDRLVYLSADELTPFLDELDGLGAGDCEIGFTGGEPFLNPDMIALAEAALSRGRRVLILTNAMRPMLRPHVAAGLKALRARHGDRLALRVSLDHYTAARHDAERAPGAFAAGLEGLIWLARERFALSVAGRVAFAESEGDARAGFARLFARHGLGIDADDPSRLVLFPEMDLAADAPEITPHCWDLVGARPEAMMCASSRMIVKRKGAAAPVVVPCTLLPYDARFEMGASLREAARETPLAHPFCAQFCVLGGASCSG